MGSWDYARHLLVWSAPILLGHWAFAPRRLYAARRALLAALGVGLALSLADALAIRVGIWRFDDRHLLGVRVLGVPVEEIAFFVITALLVAQSLVLFQPDAPDPSPPPPPTTTTTTTTTTPPPPPRG